MLILQRTSMKSAVSLTTGPGNDYMEPMKVFIFHSGIQSMSSHYVYLIPLHPQQEAESFNVETEHVLHCLQMYVYTGIPPFT